MTNEERGQWRELQEICRKIIAAIERRFGEEEAAPVRAGWERVISAIDLRLFEPDSRLIQ